MENLLGIFGLLTAILAWGSYMVPLKGQADLSPLRFQVWMSLGIGLSSIAVGVMRGFPSFSLMGIGSGIIWTIGALLSFWAIRVEGLAGASSRWMGTGILVSFLSGVVVLGEKVNQYLAFGGVLFLIFGLVLISKADSGVHSESSSNFATNPLQKSIFKQIFKYWRSVVSGVIFGTYLLPLPFADVNAFDYIAPMGVGILLGGILIAIILPKTQKAPPALSIGCGLAWNLANIGSLFTVNAFGFAVGFPLTQLALLVSLAWSVGLYGEYSAKSAKIRLLLGAIILLMGATLLGLARKF